MKELYLKTVDHHGMAYKDFLYPLTPSSKLTCPDWNPEATCGGGLHFLRWGAGIVTHLDHYPTPPNCSPPIAIAAISLGSAIDIPESGLPATYAKTKLSHIKIIKTGLLRDVASFVARKGNYLQGTHNATCTMPEPGTIRLGKFSCVHTGDHASITVDNASVVVAGDNCTIIAGNECIIQAGQHANIHAGRRCFINSGDYSSIIDSGCSVYIVGIGSRVLMIDESIIFNHKHGRSITLPGLKLLSGEDLHAYIYRSTENHLIHADTAMLRDFRSELANRASVLRRRGMTGIPDAIFTEALQC